MKNGRTRHINKAGFVSDMEYDPKGAGPLLAVVGDSYIEAMQVDWRDTIHANLARATGDRGRVYAFGAAFAGLPQYLAWASLARDGYRPSMLVVNVVGNDFLQPLPAPGDSFRGGFQGMDFFDTDAAGELVIKQSTRPPESLIRKILRHSAVVSYAYRNLDILAAPQRLSQMAAAWSRPRPETPTFVANTVAKVDEGERKLAQRQIDLFLALLPKSAGLPPQSIVITMDGIRPELYDPQNEDALTNSFPAEMANYLNERATALGFEVIPLQPLFIAEHRRSGQVFEFPFNNHWNANGHRVMAEGVLASQTYARTFAH